MAKVYVMREEDLGLVNTVRGPMALQRERVPHSNLSPPPPASLTNIPTDRKWGFPTQVDEISKGIVRLSNGHGAN